MLLSINQSDEVETMLRDKEDLIEKREHNKKEVKLLKIMEKVATGLDLRRLNERIELGERWIEFQTIRLNALTDKEIAGRVGANVDSIRYHMESKHNVPSRQLRIMKEIKRRNAPAHKGALRSVF